MLDDYAHVDLLSPGLPAYFGGLITKLPSELDPTQLALAIAVNGTIRNTTRAIIGDDGLTFMTRIPSHGLVPGRNEITVYAIVEDSDGGQASLAHLVIE